MKSTVVIIVFIFFCFKGFGQKLIDSAAYRNWPEVGDGKISDDGKYLIYETSVFYEQSKKLSGNLILESSDLTWQLDLGDVRSYRCRFTTDNRYLLVPTKNSLKIIDLRNRKVETVTDLHSSKFPKEDQSMWFGYNKERSQELVVRNLTTGDTLSFPNVTNYVFNPAGNDLVLTNKVSDSLDRLVWVDLRNRHLDTIARASGISRLTFDSSGSKLAFLEGTSKIGCYDSRKNRMQYIPDTMFERFGANWRLGGITAFSRDGERLFLSLESVSAKESKGEDGVTVWSYKDAKLVSQQLLEGKSKVTGCFVFVLASAKIFEIGQPNDVIMLPFNSSGQPDDMVLVRSKLAGDLAERNWNKSSQVSFYLVDTKTGEPLRKDGKIAYFPYLGVCLSLDGRFLLYYDNQKRNMFTLNLSTYITTNITKDIPTSWTGYDVENATSKEGSPIVAGWINYDHSVLLCDQNDIWKIDLAGIKPPQNITSGIGKKKNIVFHPMSDNSEQAIRSGDTLLLSAFNRSNKDNGFYRVVLGAKDGPQLLTMGPYLYYTPEIFESLPPRKAKNASIFLVQRMTAEESPNWYLSNDLRSFKRVSNNFPEKNFNWVKTELVQWQTFDGSVSQGILYKPQDFDPKKKYPVIFYYYEKLSDLLHCYLKPRASHGPLDIATFVSRGYLVFTPDIHYTLGDPGAGAYNSVVSAAGFLAKMPFVDARHMGIEGHSFGGYETDYIVTHTHLFQAAVSASGVSDLVGAYLQIWDVAGYAGTAYYEMGQGRMFYTLWQRPDLYLKNSPVMRADFVTTPLLLMNNKGDDAVPFRQGLEMLIALRRLGKKAWLLEYRDGDHTVGGQSALDYNKRLLEFFDHFLKGAQAPDWL
jgi:dipeptidyl aminopeptidase/acylaminoacyl peptidase